MLIHEIDIKSDHRNRFTEENNVPSVALRTPTYSPEFERCATIYSSKYH
jgi:hypothetical protein